MTSNLTRRDFMNTAAAGAAALAISPAVLARAARGGEELRVGVIGCGGRGTGAAVNALEADPATRLVALADLFEDRLKSSLEYLAGREDFAGRVQVTPERRYTGFDAYSRLLADGGVDYVICATPPHFRPEHVRASIEAGCHVFMEKPAAVDPAGVRMVIEAGETADRKGLSVVAGTQRRHQDNYLQAMQRIEDGAIGEVLGGSCYWNQGGLWVHERKPEYSEIEWQCRNWLYFCWLSGDHICEQHVHNLDVMNWALGGPPQRALGMGGRQVRTDVKYGNIFDHFAIEYDYGDGRSVTSMCRQIDGCAGRVEERIRGSAGRAVTRHGYSQIVGSNAWKATGRDNPYATEHVDLIASIRGQRPRLNEARQVAESTLTAIMGRMSAYSGKEVAWEEALSADLRLGPSRYALGSYQPDPVPTPGRNG